MPVQGGVVTGRVWTTSTAARNAAVERLRRVGRPDRCHGLRGTCVECSESVSLRLDGTVRTHGPHPWGPNQWDCPGSRRPPTDGVLIDCIWCGALFLSEDDGHRFCSNLCADAWETEDGSWEGWPVADWIADRHLRAGAAS